MQIKNFMEIKTLLIITDLLIYVNTLLYKKCFIDKVLLILISIKLRRHSAKPKKTFLQLKTFSANYKTFILFLKN